MLVRLERKIVKRKRVLGTLKVLGNVLEQLTKEVSPEEAERLIPEELKRVIESDAAMTEDLVPYNIIPLDAPALSNPIVSFSEVRAAISSLKYYRGLPKLPGTFSAPLSRSLDMFDFLHYTFGFQAHDWSGLATWPGKGICVTKAVRLVKLLKLES